MDPDTLVTLFIILVTFGVVQLARLLAGKTEDEPDTPARRPARRPQAAPPTAAPGVRAAAPPLRLETPTPAVTRPPMAHAGPRRRITLAEARNGLVQAEILGPCRGDRPYGDGPFAGA